MTSTTINSPASEIVHLNVGGRRFSTSRHTLLWNRNSFFSILLSGRLPSYQDENGAYFIDRDPDLFVVILSYLRTGELNLSGVDPISLKNEAQFYGLDSLVKKLSLCEENFFGQCGDLLFHAYMPSPCESNFPANPSVNTAMFAAPGNAAPKDGPDAGPTGTTCSPNPVTLISCHLNMMAVVYKDCVGLFFLRDPTGWHLVWLSPRISPIDRIALNSKTQSATIPHQPVSPAAGNLLLPPASNNTVFYAGSTMAQSVASPPLLPSSAVATIPYPAVGSVPNQLPSNSNTGAPHSPSTVPSASSHTSSVAVAVGSVISVWCIYHPPPSRFSAVVSYGGAYGVSTSPSAYRLSPLIPFSATAERGKPGHYASLTRAKDPWPYELIGRYDLNGRPVDHLMFIGSHLVALSRSGLVGVRHLTTNTWQVWCTVPILCYGVAASELLVLGCANGHICSINIQKFPLRLVDNDLLVTEMYRDPLRDPITALSVHLTPKTSNSGRNCLEIAYGTLTGRVCLIVQYPENVGYSPQLLQTFTVHRSMVTKVVLSEKHLISVCNEFNHVRTWAVTRFRGVISTQPGSTPIASFHITALDANYSQTLVDSVVKCAKQCASRSRAYPPTSIDPPVVPSSLSVGITSVTTGPPSSEVVANSPPRQSRSVYPSFLSHWRCHGSNPRTISTTCTNAGSESFDHPMDTSHETRLIRNSTRMTSGSSSPIEQSIFDLHANAFAATNMESHRFDLFDLPRTSWLHEDISTNNTNVFNPLHLHDTGHPAQPTVGRRCHTFHEGGCRYRPGSGDAHAALSSADTHSSSSPCISVHRHANDPGPYGEREDVLVFVQKLTPNANLLYVRLAATGTRLCVIRSVDGTPISSFCVHEHDGSNRIGAHPRRFIFTGHTDGSIQVWDLTTALKCFRSSMPTSYLTGGYETFLGSDTYNPVSSAVSIPGASSMGLINGQLNHPMPMMNANVPLCNYSGGPNSRELIRLLESCYLDNASNSSSLIGLNNSPAQITPTGSCDSVVNLDQQ